MTLAFEKNAIFFAENGRKSQKIVIITSTPEASFLKKRSRLRAKFAPTQYNA
jgi:hypothetical protein